MWKKIKDFEDYEINEKGEVKSFKKHKDGYILKQTLDGGYVRYCLRNNDGGKTFASHLLVWDHFADSLRNGIKLQVDHIDENKLNNHINNLQLLVPRQNKTKAMKKYNTSSKYVGVFWQKGLNKWRSVFWIGKKRTHLGVFENEYDAHLAYQKKLKEHNGQ